MKETIPWLVVGPLLCGVAMPVQAQPPTPYQVGAKRLDQRSLPVERQSEEVDKYQVEAKRLGQRLGVGLGDPWEGLLHSLNLPTLDGALVVSVDIGGPGERAGLRVGDLILEVDGQRVIRAAVVPSVLVTRAPGQAVSLKVSRQKKSFDVHVVLPLIPEIESARQAEAAQFNCTAFFCRECAASAVPVGDFTAFKCDSCRKNFGPEIAACVARLAPSEPAALLGTAPPVATPPPMVVDPASIPQAALVNPPLALNRVTLKPETVEPGGQFTLEVAYSSDAVNTVSFHYVISANGRDLVTSRVEELEGGGGQPMVHARTLAAANAPGTYQIRVMLMANDITTTREVSLTVKGP